MAMDSEIILKEMNQTGVQMNTGLQPSIGSVVKTQTKTDIQIWMVHGRTQDGNCMELGPIISKQTQHNGVTLMMMASVTIGVMNLSTKPEILNGLEFG